jgi:hypothetical protein
MKIISHRGNTIGPSNKENDIIQLDDVSKHMVVEVDVWLVEGVWFIGHDSPETPIPRAFLGNGNFILHAKNLEALNCLALSDSEPHYFWHQEDDYTLTSKNFIWTYPRKEVASNCIIVCQSLEETKKYADSVAWGVCTDFAGMV